MTYMPVDNVQTMCGQRPDDICHLPAEISNEVSLSCRPHIVHMSSACHPHVICTSSAHRLHIVRHEISTPKYFQSKSRTALLKIKCCINKSLKIPSSGSSGRVRGEARNMKSMWLPSAAIFFMTNFYRARGAMAPQPPLDPLLIP